MLAKGRSAASSAQAGTDGGPRWHRCCRRPSESWQWADVVVRTAPQVLATTAYMQLYHTPNLITVAFAARRDRAAGGKVDRRFTDGDPHHLVDLPTMIRAARVKSRRQNLMKLRLRPRKKETVVCADVFETLMGGGD